MIVSSATSAAFAAVLLAGLVIRRKADASLAFTAYVVTALLGHLLLAGFPTRFWNWEFMLVTDVIQALLRFAVAFELGIKTYRPLPEGYRRLRLALGAIVLLTIVGVASLSGGAVSARDGTLLCARVSYGATFLYVVYLALSAYYRVPLDPVFRDVAIGFAFLALLTGFTDVLARLDPIARWGRDFLVKVSYPLLLAWWARRMWQPEETTGFSREEMTVLQPWRVKRSRWTR